MQWAMDGRPETGVAVLLLGHMCSGRGMGEQAWRSTAAVGKNALQHRHETSV